MPLLSICTVLFSICFTWARHTFVTSPSSQATGIRVPAQWGHGSSGPDGTPVCRRSDDRIFIC